MAPEPKGRNSFVTYCVTCAQGAALYCTVQGAVLRVQVRHPRYDGGAVRGAAAEPPRQPAAPHARQPLHRGDRSGHRTTHRELSTNLLLVESAYY